SASGLPTWTTSSTSALILVTVPLVGAGTSGCALAVETSTTVCPSSTKSPSETCHSSTVPSVTDSPISGITTCTVDVVAITCSYSRTSTSSDAGEVAAEPVDCMLPCLAQIDHRRRVILSDHAASPLLDLRRS